MEKFTIAVDAMGGDNAPNDTVKGAVDAILENKDITVILVGKTDIIKKELLKYKYDKNKIIIQNASEVIENCEPSVIAIKEKKDSSIVVGLKLLKEEKAKAFVSAGSTGALLTGATIIIKRIQGVKRPALATLIPNSIGGYTFLIDAGANMGCKPAYLPDFAMLGSVYMENVMGVENPRVGLINVGSEEGKGDNFTKEAYALLEDTKNINFIGNVEGRDLGLGGVDVIVCDGFIGNVMLKVCEGMAKSISTLIKDEIKSNIVYSIGGAIASGAFKKVKKRTDYSEVGGAPFLGLKSLVIKAHGSSNSNAIKNAINQCYIAIKSDMVEKMEQSFTDTKENIL